MSTDEERLARVTLSAVGEPGSLRLTRFVWEMGPVEVLRLLRTGGHGGQGADVAQRLAATDPARVLADAAAAGLRFVTPDDPEWPTALGDLHHAPELHERGGVPLGLWVKGRMNLGEAVAQAVAVVGSRSATTYGAQVAGAIGADLARSGHCVISGAAVGIDQAGHRGALSTRGPTIAVLACGADRIYPQSHARLLSLIAEEGLIVSETAPGGAPMRIRFLARNRLIAALSQGTVVVEAAIRSGALNTASWAGGLGRVVMGVPGPVTSAPSQGVHELIRSRGAVLVTRAEEVLEAVAPIGEQTLFELREPEQPRDRLTGEQRQVLDAVPVARAAALDRIAHTAGLQVTTVARALDRLRDAGLVGELDGRWRLIGAEPDQ